MNGFYAQVASILKAHGFYFIRQGKGSHEIWGNNNVTVTVPSNCKSKFTANAIFKSAGIKQKL